MGRYEKKVRKFCQRFRRHYCQWREKQIASLQTRRSTLIVKHPVCPAILNQLLPTVEQQLGILQKESGRNRCNSGW